MYGQLFEHAFIPGKHINPYLKAENAIKKYESSPLNITFFFFIAQTV
jgi:hypothetical protein